MCPRRKTIRDAILPKYSQAGLNPNSPVPGLLSVDPWAASPRCRRVLQEKAKGAHSPFYAFPWPASDIPAFAALANVQETQYKKNVGATNHAQDQSGLLFCSSMPMLNARAGVGNGIV